MVKNQPSEDKEILSEILKGSPNSSKQEQPALSIEKPQGNLPKGVEAILEGHSRAITSIAISKDGKFLASSSLDGDVRLWDLSSNPIRCLANLEGSSSGVAFSPDGKLLASGTREKGVALWDLAKKSPNKKWDLFGHVSRPFALAFSQDGRWLASGSYDPLLRIWDMSGPEPSAWAVIAGEDGRSVGILSLCFSKDSKLLAMASAFGKQTFRLWDVSGSYMKELKAPSQKARLVLFGNDGKTLLVANDHGEVSLFPYEGHDFKLKRKFFPHDNPGQRQILTALASSPDGKQFATASSAGQLKIWQTDNIIELKNWILPVGINALCFGKIDRDLFCGNNNGTIYLFSLTQKE